MRRQITAAYDALLKGLKAGGMRAQVLSFAISAGSLVLILALLVVESTPLERLIDAVFIVGLTLDAHLRFQYIRLLRAGAEVATPAAMQLNKEQIEQMLAKQRAEKE